ncbi:MAG: hypothetical protein SVX43_14175 [Cyanobacteriota bacterium]|nr:hypothetical protein [Cyanobacteriota bacterium]
MNDLLSVSIVTVFLDNVNPWRKLYTTSALAANGRWLGCQILRKAEAVRPRVGVRRKGMPT